MMASQVFSVDDKGSLEEFCQRIDALGGFDRRRRAAAAVARIFPWQASHEVWPTNASVRSPMRAGKPKMTTAEKQARKAKRAARKVRNEALRTDLADRS